MRETTQNTMENSISQKRNNGGFMTSHRSVYDDVFGATPKLGPTTLAPRLEDYAEIFNGFHSSRCSSIPMLDVPLIIGDESFDSMSLDYGEVFGLECKDWTASFQDVVGQSSAGYDSSDEHWSPAKSGSLSDELDPLAASDKSYRWSDEDSQRSLQNKRHFNVSYNRSGQKTIETVLSGASPVTKFGEDEHCNIYVTDAVQYKKSLSDPLENGHYVHENDDHLSEKHGSDTSSMNKPFMTISDISLRTKPCRVPPPSRPPPALAVKKELNSKLKASKTYAFERVADTTTSLFFDVEVDGNLYDDGMKDVNLKQACIKGSVKRVDSWDDSKWHLEEVIKEEEKVNKTTDLYTGLEGDKLLKTHGKETIITGPVAWREEKEYFEVIEKDISMEPFEPVAHSNVSMESPKPETSKSLVMTESEASEENEDGKKVEVRKEASTRDDNRNQLEMAKEVFDWGTKHRRERTKTMSSDQKEFRAKVMPEKLVPVCTTISDHDLQDGESRKPRADLDAQTIKNSNRKQEKYIVRNEHQRRPVNLNHAEIGERVKQHKTSWRENENKLEESHMSKEEQRTVKDANKQGERGNSCSAVDRKVGEHISFIGDKEKEMLLEVVADKLNELRFSSAFEDLALERGEERNGDALLRDDKHPGVEKAEIGQDMYLSADAGVVLPSEEAKESKPIETNVRPVKWNSESDVPIEGDYSQVIGQACYPDNDAAAKVARKDENPQNPGKSNVELKILPNCSANESEAGSVDSFVVDKFNKVSKDEDEQREENICFGTNNKAEGSTGAPTCIMPDKIAPPMGYSHDTNKYVPTIDNQEQMMKGAQVTVEEVETKDNFTPRQVVNGNKLEDTSSVSECNKDEQYSSKIRLNQSVERKDKNHQHLSKNAPSQIIGRKDKNTKENLDSKDQKVGDRIRRNIELENEHLRKVEEEREREREREKDRMAVDKVAFEAYERSHVETREKAERAAVERATTEVRQRAMAVARERLEKASMEARQRTERAAVERATAEARQRAIERSKAEKPVYERSINDRFSVPSRSTDTKQSFVSSNIHFQDQGLASGLRHSIHLAGVVAEGESPQRCKARFERYRRTAERAANALAEKNKRDLLAQKEREERNRVAETLDTEVKRWSSGKEGNLRALLSTLQYILGPNSGWQPVPLTEVITSAAVKKAYRKATLCVHPDKLQQRGATIHQKYTCEKVFDLLKEAWNKFNSEER